jgi:NADPH-dependent 2,4-dienoyl-CoA reductase/sulfur reductase-like enzyme
MKGQPRKIRHCVADNWCFEIFGKAEMRCSLNAAAGRELRYGEVKPAEHPKKVLVVGAGPAGMEAARVAGLRGHSVTLYEKTDRLGGGELRLAAAAPHKEDFETISAYFSETFKELPNVKVVLGTEATADMVLRETPDAVVIATGGRSLIPPIPGVDRSNIVTAFDVLAGSVKIEGKTVVVCGGNAVGCETADYLAKRKNRVTLVEMLDAVGMDIEPVSLSALKEELAQGQVKILTGKKVEAFSEEGVVVTDGKGMRTTLEVDFAVLALGVEPVDQLARDLVGKVRELYTLGDAARPAKIHDAVAGAFVLSFNL